MTQRRGFGFGSVGDVPTLPGLEPQHRKGRWERIAEHRVRLMRRKGLLDELTAGYADQLRAAGLALDLAEDGGRGSGGTVAYAVQAWQQAMSNLVPPPGRAGAGEQEEDRDGWFDDDPNPGPTPAGPDLGDPTPA
jgi:hypothetical protein